MHEQAFALEYLLNRSNCAGVWTQIPLWKMRLKVSRHRGWARGASSSCCGRRRLGRRPRARSSAGASRGGKRRRGRGSSAISADGRSIGSHARYETTRVREHEKEGLVDEGGVVKQPLK